MASFQTLNAQLIAAQTPKDWFPNARQNGLSLRVGDLQGSAGSSLWICLRTGRWCDHATGEGGNDLISLYAATYCLSQSEAKRELEGDGFFRAVEVPKAPKTSKVLSAEKFAYITSLWASSVPAQGTAVEVYLRSRAIDMAVPQDIRALSMLYHTPSQQEFPAMLAAVRHGRSGELTAVHRTWLKPDGSGKACIEPNRMMLGQVMGGALPLSAAAPEMIIAEGIETALSVMQMTGVSTWAALSTSGLKGLALPPVAQNVTIACDNDPAGLNAANDVAEKWTKEGRDVCLAIPPLNKDFNDLLIGKE
jgi:phage/plasmid primase-like uncharacterized protein